MVKYALMLVAAGLVLVAADSAQARGRRHGCANGHCYSGGCPGGNCYAGVPVAPAKTAAVVTDPAAVAATPATETTPVVTTQSAPRYYTTSRRLFRRWAN
jgi:hypothetical protein